MCGFLRALDVSCHLKQDLFIFVFCVCISALVHYVNTGPVEPRRGCQIPGTGDTNDYELPGVCARDHTLVPCKSGKFS